MVPFSSAALGNFHSALDTKNSFVADQVRLVEISTTRLYRFASVILKSVLYPSLRLNGNGSTLLRLLTVSLDADLVKCNRSESRITAMSV